MAFGQRPLTKEQIWANTQRVLQDYISQSGPESLADREAAWRNAGSYESGTPRPNLLWLDPRAVQALSASPRGQEMLNKLADNIQNYQDYQRRYANNPEPPPSDAYGQMVNGAFSISNVNLLAVMGGTNYDPSKVAANVDSFLTRTAEDARAYAASHSGGGSFLGDLVGRIGEAITSPAAMVAALPFAVPAAASALGVEGVSAPSLLGTSGATSAAETAAPTAEQAAQTAATGAATDLGNYGLSNIPTTGDALGTLTGNAGADAVTAANTLGTAAGGAVGGAAGGGVLGTGLTTSQIGTGLSTAGSVLGGTTGNTLSTLGTLAGTVGGGATGGGGSTLGTLGAGLGVVASTLGLGGVTTPGPGGTGYTPSQAQQIADPFAPNRAQYATQLNQLMANPSSVQNLPGYQAQMQQGMQAVERGAAARGQAVSGGEQAALFNLGSGQQSNFFNTYLQQLMNLSGANQNPAAGFQAGQQAWVGNVNQAQMGIGNQSSMLGGLAQNLGVLSNMFGTGSPANTTDPNILTSNWNTGP